MTFFYSALATFLYVWMRAFQQLNVVHRKYWRIPIASFGMGVLDVTLIYLIIQANTVWIGVGNGVGGALGCYLAMWVHDRWERVTIDSI